MSVKIHPQAVIHPGADIDEHVKIGPYAVVDKGVQIGSSTRIECGVHLTGETEIGKNCHIYSYAVIGSAPQDLKYKKAKSFLRIGNDNIIREFVTINPGTDEGTYTRVGNSNLIMAYSHIAHNSSLGDHNVLANGATIAGHVEIGDHVVIGGLVAVHQFCRLGDYCIVGGCSKVVQDIPPYSLCDGHPAKVHGVNLIGLRRAQFRREKIDMLRKAFKLLFFAGHSFSEAKEVIPASISDEPEIKNLISFITSSKRGICR